MRHTYNGNDGLSQAMLESEGASFVDEQRV